MADPIESVDAGLSKSEGGELGKMMGRTTTAGQLFARKEVDAQPHSLQESKRPDDRVSP